MKKFALIATIIVMGCCRKEKAVTIPVKPLYVIDKGYGGYTGKDCFYKIVDSKGQVIIIEDDCEQYHIGDSIK